MLLDFLKPKKLLFEQNNKFPIPPREEFKDQPIQYHLTATTKAEMNKTAFIALLYPLQKDQDYPSMDRICDEKFCGIRIKGENDDLVLVNSEHPKGVVNYSSYSCDAYLFAVCKNNNIMKIFFADGTHFKKDSKRGVSFTEPVDCSIVWKASKI